MKIWLAKRGKFFAAADPEAERMLERLNHGEAFIANVIRARSLQWHRMYFGLCAEIGRNQDPERDAESIDMELRILSGHYDVMYVEGHEVRVPKRIAFEKLTADEWSEYFKRAEQAIVVRFGGEYIAEIAA